MRKIDRDTKGKNPLAEQAALAASLRAHGAGAHVLKQRSRSPSFSPGKKVADIAHWMRKKQNDQIRYEQIRGMAAKYRGGYGGTRMNYEESVRRATRDWEQGKRLQR